MRKTGCKRANFVSGPAASCTNANALASPPASGQVWRVKTLFRRLVFAGVFVSGSWFGGKVAAQGPAPTPLFTSAPAPPAKNATEPGGVHELTKADIEAFLDGLLPAQIHSRDIAGAVVATILVMWAGLSILMQYMETPALRRPAMLLLSLTFSQVFLGIGAYMARVAYADAPQPMPLMVCFTVAHVAVGSLGLGAAVALAMIVYRHPRSEPVLAQGGIVIA